MNKIVSSAMIFLGGVLVGGGITYLFLDKKYKKIAEDEIESVRNAYQKMKDKVYEKRPPEELAEKYKNEKKEESATLNDILHRYGAEEKDKSYIDLTEAKNEMEVRKSIKKAVEDREKEPYEITEEEFGEFDDYTPISLTYYTDGIVADERDVPLEDMERVIGLKWQENFDTICYIRNDALKCDYEIAQDLRSYSDVIKSAPYLGSEF